MRHSHAVAGVPVLLGIVSLLLCTDAMAAQQPTHRDSTAGLGQTVSGRVLDESSRGIPDVDVRAANGGNVSASTDSSGRFVLRGVPTGVLQLVARKVGYDSASANVSVGTSEASPEVVILLTRSHQLTEIVVKGQAYDRVLWDRGFYRRKKMTSGQFFDADDIKHFGGDGLGSIVRQAPRVEIRRITNSDYAFSTIGGRPCRMNIFIDGMFQRVAMPGSNGEEGLGLNDLVGVGDVAAVEVYPRATTVPTQFSRMGPNAGRQGMTSAQIGSPSSVTFSSPPQGENADAACGAIVIWTKPPTSQTKNP